MDNTLVKANFGTNRGEIGCEVEIAVGADPRVLIMMAQAMLLGLEQRGFMTDSIVQAKKCIDTQLGLWEMSSNGQISNNGHGGLLSG